MTDSIPEKAKLIQTYGDRDIRFAAPDLLDYSMIFKIVGGEHDGERLKVESSYHICCGTLEILATLFSDYKRWQNKMDGCPQHRREADGEKWIRDIIWDLATPIET
jgi:hypothetical protein